MGGTKEAQCTKNTPYPNQLYISAFKIGKKPSLKYLFTSLTFLFRVCRHFFRRKEDRMVGVAQTDQPDRSVHREDET